MVILLFLLGLCFGSFVNALVWRLHEQETGNRKQGRQKTSNKRQTTKDLSILRGRSMCPNCHHTLAWYDLIPVVSWLSLKAKCRYCRQPISPQYPMVELLAAVLFALSYRFSPLFHPLHSVLFFSLWLLILTIFIALAIYDLRWLLLPNKLIAWLSAVTAANLVLNIIKTPHNGFQLIISSAAGVLIIAGLFYALFVLSQGRWIGGGDVKLGIPLGLLVGGPLNAFLVIFLASLLGSLAGIPLSLAKSSNLKAKIPFGPFLIAATIAVYLFSPDLAHYYHTFLLTYASALSLT